MPTGLILEDYSINKKIRKFDLRVMICKNLKSQIFIFQFILFQGLLIFSCPLYSQQNKDIKENSLEVKHSILLIPFKPTMLMSEIGKAVNAQTKLNYNQIVDAFRYRMDLSLYNTFSEKYTTESLMQHVKKTDTTLFYIYSCVGYNYDLLPGQDTTGESHSEFDPNLQKKHFIQNGQLQVPIDYSKRFMNVDITDHRLLPYLNKKYGSDLFIFINELDIKNVTNPTEDLNESNLRREVTAHYSILNIQGHYIAKGIFSTYFPYSVNDPKVIGEKNFTIIAQSIMTELDKKLLAPATGKTKKTASTHTN
jgi:hypothetical protein